MNKSFLLKVDEHDRDFMRRRDSEGECEWDSIEDAACEILALLDGLSYEMASDIIRRTKRLLKISCRVRMEDIPSRKS